MRDEEGVWPVFEEAQTREEKRFRKDRKLREIRTPTVHRGQEVKGAIAFSF